LTLLTQCRPNLRLAQRQDLPWIAEFLPQLGGDLFPERYPGRTTLDFYEWKYLENPAGRAVVGIAVIGEQVVSVVAAVPKRVVLQRVQVVAYELGDFLTDSHFRGNGLFSALIELVCKEISRIGGVLAYVRPNESSFPILLKLGFIEAQQMESRRYVVPSATLSRKTGMPARTFQMAGLDWASKRYCVPLHHQSSVVVEDLQRFDSSIDPVWENNVDHFQLALCRDSAYLNWRFAKCPTPYRIFVAHDRGNITGYMVTFIQTSAPIARILELVAEPNDLQVPELLVATVVRAMLDSGIESIHTWTAQERLAVTADAVLRRLCPLTASSRLHVAVRILHPECVRQLPSTGWYLSAGDFDGF
jgi:hypothetical protein